jgi:hypothetical protein
MRGCRAVPLLLLLAACAPKAGTLPPGPAPVTGVSRADCLPADRLPPDLRVKSEDMLLKALDAEALFTLVGGLKPMSTVGVSFTFPADRTDGRQVEERRRILSVWRCGEDLFADARVFRAVTQGTRTVGAEVFYRPAVEAVLKRHAAFFAPLGLTPGSHPMEVLTAIEWSDRSPRWRGQGYLYGYPDYAVDFFVEAGESEARTGQFVARDPVRVPTFGGTLERSSFVWTVPRGHQENDEDRALKLRAERILTAYTARRGRYIGPGKAGAFALLRDWYCGGSAGQCSPEYAR